MYKAICNLITNEERFDNGSDYSLNQVNKLSKELLKSCFVKTDNKGVAVEVKEEDNSFNETLTLDELKAALTNMGIEFNDKAKKPELLELLNVAQA